MQVTEEMKQALAQDGAIVLRRMFDPAQMKRLREAFDHAVTHPSPISKRVFEGTDDEHFNDLSNPEHAPRYLALIEELGLADLAAELWGRSTCGSWARSSSSSREGSPGARPGTRTRPTSRPRGRTC